MSRNRVEALRLNLPCPSCQILQPLVAGVRCETGRGAAEAIARECARCWTKRAHALNEERARLRESGELVTSSRMTWQGALLSDDATEDGLEDALVSALMRRDLASLPVVRLRVPAPELVGVATLDES